MFRFARPTRATFDVDAALGSSAPQIVSVPGSARLAIRSMPPFDRYYFIEKDEDHCEALQRLAADFRDRSIECHGADANQLIQHICREMPWHRGAGTRGVRARQSVISLLRKFVDCFALFLRNKII